MNHTEKEQSVHLTEYYYILTKHKSLIIASFVITVALTLLFTLLMKPVYMATATIVIEKQQSASPLTGERLDYESYVSQSLTFNTHFKLITSRSVLEQVIKNLKLDREAELEVSPLKKFLSQFKKNIRLLLGRKEKLLTPREKLSKLIKKLQAKIDIEEVRDTRLLRVNAEDHDPAMARDIANVLAKAYIDFDINNRMRSSQNTLGWLTDHLYEMKKELEDAEEEFLAYKQRETLISVEESQKIIAQKITEFNDAYIQTRNRRLELDAKLEQLEVISKSGKDIPNLRSLIANEFINNLYSQLMNAELELSHLVKVYKSKHNKVVQARTRIDNTRKKLHQEMRKELDNLKAERTVLLAKERILQKTMADFKKEAMKINRKELNFNILKRNVEMNQNLYDTLLSRLKEADITGNIDVSNIRIATKAVSPMFPVRPNKKLNLILSVIFGLMIGIGCSFLWEYLDRSLRTEEDVQRYLGLPVLSVIPLADQGETERIYRATISESKGTDLKDDALKKYGSITEQVKTALKNRKPAFALIILGLLIAAFVIRYGIVDFTKPVKKDAIPYKDTIPYIEKELPERTEKDISSITSLQTKKEEAQKETFIPQDTSPVSLPYSILLASFRAHEDAQKSVTAYVEKGLSPYRVKINLGDKGIWHRVFAGHFKDVTEAERTIKDLKLIGAIVKKTKYAALIGTYSSEETLNAKNLLLLKYGYSPYITKGNGKSYLYVGAFYTRIGAENQCSELISNGIQCQVVER